MNRDRIRATFLGTYIGDTLGMPVETWSAKKIRETYNRLASIVEPPKNHRFHKGLHAGDWTDDTQLTVAVAEGLIHSHGALDMDAQAVHHVQAFHASTAGWGGTTKKALNKLAGGEHWTTSAIGFGPKSGKGNGVGMKISPLGLYYAVHRDQPQEVLGFAMKLSKMTHYSNIAAASGMAILGGVMWCGVYSPDHYDPDFFLDTVLATVRMAKYPPEDNDPAEPDLDVRLQTLKGVQAMTDDEIIAAYGAGSCFCYDSIPFSLAFFMRKPTSFDALLDCVNAGGDTDSNGAMVGAMLGALNGTSVFPKDILKQLKPNLVQSLIETADRFAGVLGVEN